MCRPVRIERRFLALIGVIAMTLAYLPQVVSVLSAGAVPSCCAGMLCPMHNMAGGHTTCGMDMTHTGTAFQACGCHSLQYTGGLVFNRVSPPLVTSERPTGTAPVLLQTLSASLEPEVLSPPPRLALS